ncbi:unnamed protein product [Rotaria magnacalcarata]|uniref:Uncharacterized protein n=1 Tax=Rotaria magnacalcarata TaxID=392030 RepID=A0A819VG12_9BILA|nr:unnamed protein product [Rotaria magnacalcarata]CAF2133824.1 unnamed protein product [Rotaria magnacalcarata]CAF4052081.1 unnamed protein product [Rotaria magnacalcarata]CAF4108298.1 unnamed protein product [Rotaria magnacalcarata]
MTTNQPPMCNDNGNIDIAAEESFHIKDKSDLIETQNEHDSSWINDELIYGNNKTIEEKFNEILLQVSDGLQNINVLWNLNATVHPHIDCLPYLLILNSMDKVNKRLTLIYNVYVYTDESNDEPSEHDSKSTSCYEMFSNFNIGTLMKLDDIFYTKDYQENLFRLSNCIKISDVIECINKKIEKPIDVNMASSSNFISIVIILNNIVYLDISHVLISEHELPLYECFKALLFEHFGRTLHILVIPTCPNLSENKIDPMSHISLDLAQDDHILCLEPRLKALMCNYFITINKIFSHQQKSFGTDVNFVDIIKNIKKNISLKSNLYNSRPIYVAVSFLTDQFHVLKNHWKKNTSKKDSHTGTAKSIDGIEGYQKGYEPELGGKFIIINWPSKEIIYTLDLDAPAGFFIDTNHLYIANNRLNYISVIDLNTRMEIRRINNRAFNCLHSIQYMDNQTILVTSTGIDAILEINLEGEILNTWYATEHEYITTPNGEQRHVSRDFDHHHYTYPTLHQTTHVNSAMILNDKYFLATLFHQGSLVKINRHSGRSTVLLSELHCPHGIKRLKSMKENDIDWMLCNTKRNEILFLNDCFTVTRKVFLEDVHWLQDASQIQNGNIIIADANNSRIIEIDPILNTVTSEFNYSTDWRIYQISDLNDFQTSFIPTLCK